MMKLRLTAAALAAVAGLVAQTPCFAGASDGQAVVVGSTYAYGAVLATRDAPNSAAYIGCYIGAYVTNADVTNTSTTTYLSCTGYSGSNSYSCYVNDPPATWVTMMSSINQLSWIYFYGDSAGHCQGLNISQSSQYL